jgi:short subunit dehydrogenase-like uncharacterized protein
MKRIMVYGATGYSGTLISQKSKEYGLHIIIAGRNEQKLKQLSSVTNYEYRVFSLDDPDSIIKAISDIDIVLNVAGPFIDGLPLFVQSCINCKKHFIDLAMDPDTLAKYDSEAKQNEVMILSGVGHAFLPLDSLGGFLFEKMPDAEKLSMYIAGMNTMSRGTAKSNIALIKYGIHHRKNSSLFRIKDIKYCKFTSNNTTKSFIPSSFGVSTLSYSTNIPTIESYFEATPAVKPFIFIIKYLSWLFRTSFMQKVMEKKINNLPSGPTEEERQSGSIEYVAIIENKNGKKLTATLSTPEAYKTTYLTTLEVLKMIDTNIHPGFQTPYRVFGYNIINSIGGCKLSLSNEVSNVKN